MTDEDEFEGGPPLALWFGDRADSGPAWGTLARADALRGVVRPPTEPGKRPSPPSEDRPGLRTLEAVERGLDRVVGGRLGVEEASDRRGVVAPDAEDEGIPLEGLE